MTTATTHNPVATRAPEAAARTRVSLRRAALAVIRPLASLRLTVVLFALSIVLIFAATLAQVDRGIWHVMEIYFKAPIAWIPLRVFFPGEAPVGGKVPMPGGVVLGGLLLLNLLAAHALRFKMKARGVRLVAGFVLLAAACAVIYLFHYVQTWHDLLVHNGLPVLFALGSLVYAPLIAATWLLFGKRLGIVLVHASLILLLVGEGVSAFTREESQLVLYEGQTASWAHDIREVELAVIEPLGGEREGSNHDLAAGDSQPAAAGERVFAFPQRMLVEAYRAETPLTHPGLPFAVDVELWYPNATLFTLPADDSIQPMATAGFGLEAGIRPLPRASGVGDQRVDLPAAVVRFMAPDGEMLGRYVVSTGLQSSDFVFRRQDLPVGDTTWEIALRFKRVALPARFTLHDFQHEQYPGTDVPSNFSSDLRLVNPAANEDREVSIYMNHPLRYEGLTFFQAGYLPGNTGTILQVVSNPAAELPYIACVAGGLGLAIHFVLSLAKFLGKQRPGRTRGARKEVARA